MCEPDGPMLVMIGCAGRPIRVNETPAGSALSEFAHGRPHGLVEESQPRCTRVADEWIGNAMLGMPMRGRRQDDITLYTFPSESTSSAILCDDARRCVDNDASTAPEARPC